MGRFSSWNYYILIRLFIQGVFNEDGGSVMNAVWTDSPSCRSSMAGTSMRLLGWPFLPSPQSRWAFLSSSSRFSLHNELSSPTLIKKYGLSSPHWLLPRNWMGYRSRLLTYLKSWGLEFIYRRSQAASSELEFLATRQCMVLFRWFSSLCAGFDSMMVTVRPSGICIGDLPFGPLCLIIVDLFFQGLEVMGGYSSTDNWVCSS